MSYSDVVTILALAPVNCSDIAQAALERLALESAASRLLKSYDARDCLRYLDAQMAIHGQAVSQ